MYFTKNSSELFYYSAISIIGVWFISINKIFFHPVGGGFSELFFLSIPFSMIAIVFYIYKKIKNRSRANNKNNSFIVNAVYLFSIIPISFILCMLIQPCFLLINATNVNEAFPIGGEVKNKYTIESFTRIRRNKYYFTIHEKTLNKTMEFQVSLAIYNKFKISENYETCVYHGNLRVFYVWRYADGPVC